MDVDIRISVRLGDLLIVHLGKPVIGSHSPGIAQDQSTHGIGNGGVLLHAPVFHLHITVDHFFIIQDRGLHVPHFFPLLAVQNVSLGHFRVARLLKDLLHTVLNVLHMHGSFFHLILKICRHAQRQQINDIIVVLRTRGVKGFPYGVSDFGKREIRLVSVSLNDLEHELSPLYLIS